MKKVDGKERVKIPKHTLIDHLFCLPSRNMVKVILNEIYLHRVHDLRKQYESQREKHCFKMLNWYFKLYIYAYTNDFSLFFFSFTHSSFYYYYQLHIRSSDDDDMCAAHSSKYLLASNTFVLEPCFSLLSVGILEKKSASAFYSFALALARAHPTSRVTLWYLCISHTDCVENLEIEMWMQTFSGRIYQVYGRTNLHKQKATRRKYLLCWTRCSLENYFDWKFCICEKNEWIWKKYLSSTSMGIENFALWLRKAKRNEKKNKMRLILKPLFFICFGSGVMYGKREMPFRSSNKWVSDKRESQFDLD